MKGIRRWWSRAVRHQFQGCCGGSACSSQSAEG
jgi:hypothetical protein